MIQMTIENKLQAAGKPLLLMRIWFMFIKKWFMADSKQLVGIGLWKQLSEPSEISSIFPLSLAKYDFLNYHKLIRVRKTNIQ